MVKNRSVEDRNKKPDIDISSIGMDNSEIAWDHWLRGMEMCVLPVLAGGVERDMYVEIEGIEAMVQFGNTIH